MKFAHLASSQAIEFVDRTIPKTLDIFLCKTGENKAFFTKRSILHREPEHFTSNKINVLYLPLSVSFLSHLEGI